MQIYYIANSIYQFAYAFPLFEKCEGIFVVTSKKKMKHFQQYLQNLKKIKSEGQDYPQPKVILVERSKLHQIKGILFFFANSIDPEQDYSASITCFYEHGTSDKKYECGNSIAIKKLHKYNYLLLSGPKNRHRLVDTKVTRKKEDLIETGCLRFDSYLKGKFSREKIAKLLKIKDTNKKNILYAPTWKFGNGTFKAYASHLIDQLSDDYNLILRPHYHDRKYGQFIYWYAKLKGKRNVYFSPPQDVIFHDTYAAFAASDLLISDISSVIYEYLITKKPIVLINNNFEQRHSMPQEIDILPHVNTYKKGDDLKRIINQNLTQPQSEKYEQLLHNCFYKTNGNAANDLAQFLKNLKNYQ